MKLSKVVVSGTIAGLFVFSICHIQDAISAPRPGTGRAATALERAQARKAAIKAKYFEKFGRTPPPPPPPPSQLPNWQPVTCEYGSDATSSTSQFVSSGSNRPLLVNINNNNSAAGAMINFSPSSPPHVLSFDVLPATNSDDLRIALLIVAQNSSGTTALCTKYNSVVVGTRYTFDLYKIDSGVIIDKPVPAGYTVTQLTIDIYAKCNPGCLGSVYIDNVSIDGTAVNNKVVQGIQCPPPLW